MVKFINIICNVIYAGLFSSLWKNFWKCVKVGEVNHIKRTVSVGSVKFHLQNKRLNTNYFSLRQRVNCNFHCLCAPYYLQYWTLVPFLPSTLCNQHKPEKPWVQYLTDKLKNPTNLYASLPFTPSLNLCCKFRSN